MSKELKVDPDTTAVLCVECQRGTLGDEAVLPALRDDAVGTVSDIERLLRAARSAGVKVVHATYEGDLGAGTSGTSPLQRVLARRSAHWKPGHPATAVLPELLEPEDLVLPRHHGLMPAWGTELLPVLRAHNVTSLVLVGASLNVALPLTAGEAVHWGFQVVVPRDAVVGTPPEYSELVLRNTMAMLAVLTSVDELVEAWSAKDPA